MVLQDINLERHLVLDFLELLSSMLLHPLMESLESTLARLLLTCRYKCLPERLASLTIRGRPAVFFLLGQPSLFHALSSLRALARLLRVALIRRVELVQFILVFKEVARLAVSEGAVEHGDDVTFEAVEKHVWIAHTIGRVSERWLRRAIR